MVGEIVVGLVFAAVCAFVWLSHFRSRKAASAYGEFESNYADRLVFVSRTRNDWYDFVLNNVVPVLPSDAEVLWYRKHCGYASPPSSLSRPRPVIDIDAFWLRRLVVPPDAPYAFVLNGETHIVKELCDSLLPLKSQGSGRDEYKQRVVAQELAVLTSHAWRCPLDSQMDVLREGDSFASILCRCIRFEGATDLILDLQMSLADGRRIEVSPCEVAVPGERYPALGLSIEEVDNFAVVRQWPDGPVDEAAPLEALNPYLNKKVSSVLYADTAGEGAINRIEIAFQDGSAFSICHSTQPMTLDVWCID